MAYININGKIIPAEDACISPGNRGFRYGYGLFETMLVKDGAIELWAYHADRLFDGLQQLYFDIPRLFTQERLHSEILAIAERNKLAQLCRVRLQVYASDGGILDAKSEKPAYIIECFPLEASVTELNESGLVVSVANGLQKSPDRLCNLKTCNALIYAIAARQAKAGKWNDALILNTSGNIIESTIANIFWVKNGIIYTPPLSEGCIAGVMRRHLTEELPRIGYTVRENILSPQILQAADAVFLTNAIRRLKWVQCVGDTQYSTDIIPAIYKKVFA